MKILAIGTAGFVILNCECLIFNKKEQMDDNSKLFDEWNRKFYGEDK